MPEDEAVKIAFVLGTTSGGTGRHVRMLAAGCMARGVSSVVFGPGETQRDFAFELSGPASGVAGIISGGTGPRPGAGASAGVTFQAVEFGDRPHVARDGLAVLRLRQLIASSGADVVHAHGLRAGALAAIALALRPGRPSPPLVVTVHNAPPSAGVNGAIYQTLELIVARSAATVLCVSADLEDRIRRAGARDVGRALVPAPPQGAGGVPAAEVEAVRRELRTAPAAPQHGARGDGAPEDAAPGDAAAGSQPGGRSTAGAPGSAGAVRRPIVLAAGRLAPQKGFASLLEAAWRWRDLDPAPLLAIAGDGPLAGTLAGQAAPLGRAVRFLGQRGDVPALLAAADVFVLPSLWEGQPLILQEALRAGRPVVATRVGGVPGLTGPDAAVLVPPGDPDALAAAVREVLTDPALGHRLAEAARARARTLPSENDAVEAALVTYRRLATAQLTPPSA
jgi:glycosyltransferase involved in cell wall biosynthesis